VLFLAWMLTPAVSEQLLRTEIGYAGATTLLALTLAMLYWRGGAGGPVARRGANAQSASTERAIAR
jgi:hypothetical protein